MPPPQIFVSTRSRREYPRRRPSGVLPVPLLLLLAAVILLVWVLAAFALWAGGL